MSLFAINNFIHLIVAVTWIGGMIFINLVLMPSLTLIEASERGKLFGAIAKRFTIISWSSMLLLLLTGLLKTPEDLLFNTSSDYGLMITVKHILFIVMIAAGTFISFVFVPKIRLLAPKPGEKPAPEFLAAQKNMKLLSMTNMILGIIILLLVSLY